MADDLHYIDLNPDDLWREMLLAYVQAGGGALYPGDEKEMLLRAVLAAAEAIMGKVDAALRMDTLTYATGEYLKEYGLKRNCAYIEAQSAVLPVTLAYAAASPARTLAAGTAFTYDGTLIYELASDVTNAGGAQTINAMLVCRTPGEAGNAVTQGTQLQLIDADAPYITVTASGDASGGADAEDEEAYRERIRAFGLSTVTTGPKAVYESRAKQASNHIIDVSAVNGGDGEVDIYLLLDADAVQADVFAAVLAALNDESARPLTDYVQVFAATSVAYTLGVKATYDSYKLSEAEVQAVIDAYKDWQDNTIGRAFNPDKLTDRKSVV